MAESSFDPVMSRRSLLQAAGVGAGLILLGSCAGDSKNSNVLSTDAVSEPQRTTLPGKEPSSYQSEVYLPTWLDEPEYDRIGSELPLGKAGRFVVAFALPSSSEGLTIPEINPGLKRLMDAGSPAMAIGGFGGSDSEHNSILASWASVLDKPGAFIDKTVEASKRFQLSAIDLDFEFPDPSQAAGLLALTQELRDKLPEETAITMAVPADATDGYRPELSEVLDQFHVMTYDFAGPGWSQTAGDVAPGQWAIARISEWVKRAGKVSKISAGFPAYGYRYPGAQKHGDAFVNDGSQTVVLYNSVPTETINDDPENMSSEAIVDGAWTSLQSPNMIKTIYASMINEHPGVGAFFWEASGMTQAHLQAVQSG